VEARFRGISGFWGPQSIMGSVVFLASISRTISCRARLAEERDIETPFKGEGKMLLLVFRHREAQVR
jgi:hypothetical protein